MYDIGSAIIAINPSAKVVVWDEDYEQIKWNDTPVISKSDIQAKIEELKAEKPMNDWKDTMNESDSSTLPRWGEDILDRDGIEDLPQALIDKFNAKKTLRSERPK